MRSLKYLRVFLAGLAIWAPIMCGEVPQVAIAVGEGAAASNAIEILAQTGTSGIVIVALPTDVDISSDLGETSYAPAQHMGRVVIPAMSKVDVVAIINREQMAASFRLDGNAAIVAIPKDDAEITKLVNLLDAPLRMGAGSICDMNDNNAVVALEDALKALAATKLPALTTWEISVWPKEESAFYPRSTKRPALEIVILNPDMTMRQVMQRQMNKVPGLIWIVRLSGSKVHISTTTFTPKRSDRPLAGLLADLKPSFAALGSYPTQGARIRDASRELHRRLLLDPGPTATALMASGSLGDLLLHILPDDGYLSVHGHLYFLMCYRHPVIVNALMEAVKAAPKNISDEFFFTTVPGINGEGPGWKEMFTPIWTSLLTSSDVALVKRAQAMLIER